MFWRICSPLPVQSVSIKCALVKVMLTVWYLSLSPALPCVLINSWQLHAETAFLLASAEITTVSSAPAPILPSLIYYSVFNLAIWGLFPRLATSKPLLNMHLFHYTKSSTQWTASWNWPFSGVIDITTIPSHHYASKLSVIAWQLFGLVLALDAWRRVSHFFLKHIHVWIVHRKGLSIKLSREVFGPGRAQKSELRQFGLRAFVFTTKVSKLCSAFTKSAVALQATVAEMARWSVDSYNHMQLWSRKKKSHSSSPGSMAHCIACVMWAKDQ